MQTAAKPLEAQLQRWSEKIDHLAAKTERVGPVSFDALMHVDELKALLAIAKSKFDVFAAAPGLDQVRLEAETRQVFADLAAALKSPSPPR